MKITFVKIGNDYVAAPDFHKALNWYRGEIDPNIDRAVMVSGARIMPTREEHGSALTLLELAEQHIENGGELPAVIFSEASSADA